MLLLNALLAGLQLLQCAWIRRPPLEPVNPLKCCSKWLLFVSMSLARGTCIIYKA